MKWLKHVFYKELWVIAMVAMTTAACAFKLGSMTPEEAFPGIHGQLVQAAVDGNTEKMEQLAKQGADPNYRGAQGSTPLMWAQAAHSHRGLEKLLELGADPNAPILKGTASVTWAAARGNDTEILRILLDHGGNPNAAFECYTLLMAAVGSLERERVDLVLSHGANINGEVCDESAPEVAAAVGRFDWVLDFLSKGYDNKLERLAQICNIRIVPKDSQSYRDKMQALEILRQRGVKIPPLRQ